MRLILDIISLPGWNTSMMMLLAKATFILIAALGITIASGRGHSREMGSTEIWKQNDFEFRG